MPSTEIVMATSIPVARVRIKMSDVTIEKSFTVQKERYDLSQYHITSNGNIQATNTVTSNGNIQATNTVTIAMVIYRLATQ